jgi:hypothetical protein
MRMPWCAEVLAESDFQASAVPGWTAVAPVGGVLRALVAVERFRLP